MPTRTDQLDACRTAQRAGTSGQPDTAEHVVRQQIRYERQEQRDEQEAEHQPVEGQLEGVEAEILAELRIVDAEVAAVQEQLNADPVGLCDDPGEQADRNRNPGPDHPQPRHHHAAIAGHRIIAVARDEHRPGAVGQRQTGEHDAADQQPHHQEHHQPGHQHGGEHRSVAQLAEPEPVDVGVDQARADKQQQDHRQGDRDESPAAPSQLRHSRGGPHPH